MASPQVQSKIDSMPLDGLRGFAKKQMSMLKNLKVKTDTLQKERVKIASDLKNKTEELDCLRLKSDTLEKSLRESETKGDQSELEFQYEELKLKHEEQTEKLQSFRGMFKVKLTTVEEEKNQLRAQFQDLLESKDCRIAELEKDLFNEERENSIEELETECEKLHKIIDELRTQKESILEAGHEKANELRSSRSTEVNVLKSEHSEEINTLIGQNKSFEEKIENLISENMQLRESMTQTAVNYNKLQEEVTATKKSLDEARTNNQKVESDNEAELDVLRKENSDLQSTIVKNLAKTSEASSEVESLQAQNSLLENEIMKLTKSVDQIKTQFDTSSVTTDNLNIENQSLKSSLAEKEELVTNMQDTNDKLLHQVETIKSELQITKSEMVLPTGETPIQTAIQTPIQVTEETSSKKIDELEDIVMRSAEEMAFMKTRLIRLDELEKLEVKFSDMADTNKKLKSLALKTKKELEENKKKLKKELQERGQLTEKLKEASSKASNATSSFQEEYDRLQDELERVNESHSQILSQHETLKEENELLKDAKEANEISKREIERVTQKLEEKEQRLDEALAREIQLDTTMMQEKRARLEEKNGLTEKLTKAEKFLEQEKTRRTQSAKELEDTRENFKTQQLINMEMKDYERAVMELKNQVESATQEADAAKRDGGQVQELLDQVRQRAEAAEDGLEAAEERAEKYRGVIEENNRELSQFREKEMRARSESQQNSILGEQLRAQVEEMKLQMSQNDAQLNGLQSDKKSTEMKFARDRIQMEKQVTDQQREIETVTEEKNILDKEFSAYKTRVHSVLKQQKEQHTDPAQLDQAKHALISAHDQIKKLQSQTENQANRHELLTVENEKIIEQLNSEKVSFADLETSARNKEKLLLERSKRMELQLSDATSKAQILEIENKRIIEDMRRRVDETTVKERNEFGLKLSIAERRATQAETELLKVRQQLRQKEDEVEIKKRPSIDQRANSYKIDPLKESRSEPVGAENDDRNAELMSLEQIIQSPNRSFSISQRSESAVNVDTAQQMQKLNAKFEHANSVLHETEAANARLTEQTGLLKNEIRRLEKNQDRQMNIHNMEYLKNVIFKFITLAPGTERIGLIPVLDTMLQLDKPEKDTLVEIAGVEQDQAHAGWGSYIPRWGGV